MNEQCSCKASPFGSDRMRQASRRHGRWFRSGDRIVVLLNTADHVDEEISLEQDNAATTESAAIRTAIQRGVRDENRLTDLLFNTRHPERRGLRLRQEEQQLIREWLEIRDTLVRPALRGPSRGGAPARPAATQPPSTTSGVEADGNTTGILRCILGLQDQGRSISFVQRYLRDLTRAEITALKSAGLKIVSCFEEGSPTVPTYFTRARGVRDGQRAFTQAQTVGQPADTPVYFAVDADLPGTPTATALLDFKTRVLDYFQGVQDGFNQYLADMRAKHKPEVTYAIGVYGSGCVLDWCKAQSIATRFWQAFAPGWCNNRTVWAGANIHTSGADRPERCGRRLGHLEGWGNEGSW